MAKTAKMKSDPSSNPRSRASRRRAAASSPASTSHIPDSTGNKFPPVPHPPSHTPQYKAATISGGIAKNKTHHQQHQQRQGRQRCKGKVQTRQQRLRQERALLRAEDVVGKLDRKVEGSLRRRKVGRERRRAWEEVNGVKGRAGLDVDGDEGQCGGGGGGGAAAAAIGGEEGAMMDVEDGWVDEMNAGAVVGSTEGGDEGKGDGGAEPEIVHSLIAEVDGVENDEDNIT